MILVDVSAKIFDIVAFIALVVLLMTSRCMRLPDVSALQGILIAARTSTDNAGGGIRCGSRGRFLDGGVGYYRRGAIRVFVRAINVIKITIATIGTVPVIIVERHRRIRVANDVRNIERIAVVGFAPECIFSDVVQRMLSVINRQLCQQRAVIERMAADDRRGAGNLGSREIGTVLEPV